MRPELEVLENLECSDLGLEELVRDSGLSGNRQAADILAPMFSDSAIWFYRKGEADAPLPAWEVRDLLRSPDDWGRHPEIRVSLASS